MYQTKLTRVLQINGLSNTDRIVLLILNQRVSAYEQICTISTASIASTAHVSVSTARRAIKRLAEKKLIKRISKTTETKISGRIAENSYYVSLEPYLIENTELLRELLEILEHKDYSSLTNYKKRSKNG